jgi:predicted Fe-Mo cluster-binding NifX family protein
MKICFPTTSNEGLLSDVYGHFGSAPMFLVVDTATGAVKEQVNRDLGHAHGQCRPMHALRGQGVDAIVVGGIGAGALMGLNRAGLKVYRKTGSTIADNLACLAQKELPELTPDQVCGGHSGAHGHGHGCGAH